MSLDKAIEHGKEKRKEYTGSKSIARSCRNHGDCLVCQGNRQYKNTKRIQELESKKEEYEEEHYETN